MISVSYTHLDVYKRQVVTNAFSSFLSVIKSIISCIGIIVILWGVFEMGTAMQGHDGVMQSGAFKRIGGDVYKRQSYTRHICRRIAGWAK